MVLHAKTNRQTSEAKAKAMEHVASEPTRRLNSAIPARMHKELKTLAASQETTVTELVIEALTEYLGKHR